MTSWKCALMGAIVLGLGSAAVDAASITGDPSADGWTLFGNSLAKGVYVDGSANYSFDAYGTGFTVTAGSDLEISDGNYSWLAGDTIVGAGGKFTTITAAEAGWDQISGTTINSLLRSSGPKMQVKFGTADATWSTSTTAPGSGNGSSSSSAGGGRVQVRTSGYFQTGTPHPGQTEPWTLDGNSGELLVLDKSDHISWSQDIDKRVARMIWIYDESLEHVTSFELLLNVSLMRRLAPEFEGLLPDIGDKAIITVQDGDGAYTNALVNVVPEPAAVGVLGLGAIGLLRRRRGA